MSLYICSLARSLNQVIPADGRYHLLRFPPWPKESYDSHAMHQYAQPDGYQIEDWRVDDRAALIWPRVDGWGELMGEVQWEEFDWSPATTQFVRDPLNLSTGYDATGTTDATGQYRHPVHSIFVTVGTPLGLQVRNGGPRPRTIAYSQFKLAIESNVAKPPA